MYTPDSQLWSECNLHEHCGFICMSMSGRICRRWKSEQLLGWVTHNFFFFVVLGFFRFFADFIEEKGEKGRERERQRERERERERVGEWVSDRVSGWEWASGEKRDRKRWKRGGPGEGNGQGRRRRDRERDRGDGHCYFSLFKHHPNGDFISSKTVKWTSCIFLDFGMMKWHAG